MSLPKSPKEWIVFVTVSIVLGVVSCAIWAGIANLAQGPTPGFPPPSHASLFRIAEFVYFVLIAVVGVFLGRYINSRFDAQWKPLYEKSNRDYLQAAKDQVEYREKYAETANERAQIKAELQRVIASIRKPSFPEHPIPDLRLRTLELCTELQAFVGTYGDKVKTKRDPTETNEQHLLRLSSPELKELRVRFVGDYCRKYRKHVTDLRDELRQRSSTNDPLLNNAIRLAEDPFQGPADNVEEAIKKFWEVALDVNC